MILVVIKGSFGNPAENPNILNQIEVERSFWPIIGPVQFNDATKSVARATGMQQLLGLFRKKLLHFVAKAVIAIGLI